MELIADIFLIAGASGAAFYCVVLSRRVSRLNDMENGVGGAIAALSSQVSDMSQTIVNARKSAQESGKTLSDLTERAENVSARLELLVASMHDIPTGQTSSQPSSSGSVNTSLGTKQHIKSTAQKTNSLFRSARKEKDETVV